MTVGELKELLEQFDDSLDVFYKLRPATGTIGEVHHVRKDEYVFFGKSLPCALLDSEKEGE